MRMKFTILLMFTFLTIAVPSSLMAQGCVAIRGFSSCTGTIGGGANLSKGQFLFGSGFRYFKSFRHFRGSHEEAERVANGTEVINHSYFLDLSLNYGLSDRWYANIVLPFVYHDRSSMYEHGGNPPNGLGERHHTSSRGLADMRIGVGYWLFNPETHDRYNYALGVGLKLPTGSYNYTDVFYNQGPDRDEDRTAVVDQSIQPGDGGWGIALDLQGYHSLSDKFMVTTTLYYLLNPMETNGVLTRNGNDEFSCPDQFAARIGFNYMTGIHGLALYLGGRTEGVPSSDLIGGKAGYRRPGYVNSVEPGVSYNVNNMSLSLNVPIALYRNRTQSYADKKATQETGTYRHGDAAFADYLISIGFSYRFGGKSQTAAAPQWNNVIDSSN